MSLPVAILCAILLAASASAASLPPQAAGKAAEQILEKADAGQSQDLLVLFDASAIDADMKKRLSQRKLMIEDDAALSLRAERYRQLKQPVLARLAAGEAELRKDYRHIPMALIRFHGAAALGALLARPEVAAVYENIRLHAVLAQSLPLIGQPAAAAMGRTGTGSTVVILDSGVNYTRSEFGNCTAPGVPAGCRVVAAFDTAASDGALDDMGHGTQVAGTVAATAPGSKLAVLDVFTGTGAYASDIIEGIDWAIANKSAHDIAAVNMSLGDGVNNTSQCDLKNGPLANVFRQPIIDARNAGIISVVASGNEGYTNGISGPACTPEALSVGAVYDANVGGIGWGICTDSTTAADKLACFSNSASFLTMLAPGALIAVTGATVGGTSFASPHVAAAVAVLHRAYPGETPDQIQTRLTSAGKPVTDSRNGIVKPRLALLDAQGAPANDAFAAAASLSGSSGQATGWNYNATKEAGEPLHAGDGGGKSVWWQWTAPSAGSLSVDTHGSDFDTLLGVYTGTEVSALSPLAASDNDGYAGNASGLEIAVLAGAVYRIAVDGKSAAAGAISLNWSFTPDSPQGDLEILLLDSPDPVQAGSPLTYTLSIINHGPQAADATVATLALGPGTLFSSADAICSVDASTVSCDLGSMANGEMRALDIVVFPPAAGTLEASANVASATADPAAGNNTDAAQTQVTAAAPTESQDTEVPMLPPWSLALLGAALYLMLASRKRPPG